MGKSKHETTENVAVGKNGHKEALKTLKATNQGENEKEIKLVEMPSFKLLIYNCMFSSEYIFFTSFLLIVLESYILNKIIATFEYTNIDYKAYMEQILMVTKFHNYKYDTIFGDTGPLVYPAGHFWIFKFLKDLTINWKIENAFGIERISEGQVVFKALYLVTTVLSFAACVITGNVYPAITAVLVLSKRLHSIYVLRLFNDCFTTILMVCTALFLCLIPSISSMIIEDGKANNLNEEFYLDDASNFSLLVSFIVVFMYSSSVSVKMNALLYFPAILLILSWLNFKGKKFLLRMSVLIAFGVALQFLVAYPFIREDMKAYFSTAFNFSRKFEYIWSVNWQFIPRDVFESDIFSKTLLILQVTTLWVFLNGKWLKPLRSANKNISTTELLTIMIKISLGLEKQSFLNLPELNSAHILYIMTTCNYIGVIFCRSLHYQFLSWYHWSIPLLLSFGLNTANPIDKLKNKLIKIFFAFCWYALHEICWNIYMPKWWSSLLLVALNSLLLVLNFINYQPEL
ncbi:hypothetical protein QEN19_003410 [Hanseniaspora menglaensis]